MTDSTSGNPSGRIAILDFLRGIAMILVILGHSQFPYDMVIMAFHFLEHIHPFHWSLLFAITLLVSPLIAWLIKRFFPFLIGEKRQNPRSYAG